MAELFNVSCPNVKKGCVAFGNSPAGISEITSKVKKYCKKPLILTPNVTDIKEIAVAAEAAGADALSLINTILGMAIDIHRKRPILAKRMVYEVLSSGEDAVEFMLAGASAVMVGRPIL